MLAALDPVASGVRHTAASFAEEVQGCVGSVGSGSAFFHALETMRHEYERLVAENELLHNGALHGALDRLLGSIHVKS